MCRNYLNEKESSFVPGQGWRRGHLPAEAHKITGSSWELNRICRYDFTAAAQGWAGLGGKLGAWVIH